MSETKGTRIEACMRSATRRRGNVIFRTVPRISPLKFLQQINWKAVPALPVRQRFIQHEPGDLKPARSSSRRRLGQRLTGLDDVNPEHFEGLVAGFCVVNCA